MEFRRVLFRSFPPALPFRRRALPARDAKAFGDGDRRGILPRGGGEPPAPGRARAAAAGHRELVCNRSFRAMAVNNRIAEFHDEMKGGRRDIHAPPATAFKALRTPDFVAEKQAAYGLQVPPAHPTTGVSGR